MSATILKAFVFDISKGRNVILISLIVCLNFCFILTAKCQTLSKTDLAEFQWNFNSQCNLNQAVSAFGFNVMKRTYEKLSKNMDIYEIKASLENIGDDSKLFDEFIYQTVLFAGGDKDYSRTVLYSLCKSYKLANKLFDYVQGKYGKRLPIDLKIMKERAERERIENEKQRKLEEEEKRRKMEEERKQEEEDENRVVKKPDIEASFKGGDSAWSKYLERNLNPSTPVDNGAPEGIYTVYVQFVVGRDGSISNVQALTSHGYGMEQEAVMVIKKGPAWIPAIWNGRNVKAWRKQSITYTVSSE